jgi:hypothetical protein
MIGVPSSFGRCLLADKFSTKCGGALGSAMSGSRFHTDMVNRRALPNPWASSQKNCLFKRFEKISKFLNRLMI